MFFSVTIHAAFIMSTVFTFYGCRFQYLKENLCSDFSPEVVSYLFHFRFLQWSVLGVICITQFIYRQCFSFSIRAHILHTILEVLVPIKNGIGLGQDKGELTNIGSNRGEVKLLWTKGMVCFRMKLFYNSTSTFAVGSCNCIENII